LKGRTSSVIRGERVHREMKMLWVVLVLREFDQYRCPLPMLVWLAVRRFVRGYVAEIGWMT
jgi:hypothetical protein